MQTGLFGKILDMSFIGCYSILVVLAVRPLLLKFGRKYAYYLWLIVFLNLCLPFSFRGNFSLIPKPVSEFSLTDRVAVSRDLDSYVDIAEKESPEMVHIFTESGQLAGQGVPDSEGYVSHETNEAKDIAKPEDYGKIAAKTIWIAGIFAIGLFNLVSILKLKKRIRTGYLSSWDAKERIAEIDSIDTPFLWGILHPVIYLPTGMEGEEKQYIIAHESCHRRRRDYLFKIAASIIVAIHWFNPFVWLAYALFCRDMETSCDETVLAGTKKNIKKQYAESLLKYAARQNGYVMTPLTFGEPSVKSRIKNVLRFRKRRVVFSVIGFFCMLVVMLGLLVRPVEAYSMEGRKETKSEENPEEPAPMAPVENTDIYIDELPETEQEVLAPEEEQEILIPVLEHREGYQEAELTFAGEPDMYLHLELWDEEEQEALAQRALQDLYDLTGYQVTSCCYTYTDLGTFHFARTKEDLQHSRIFYSRSYGEEEGYPCIPSMSITSARRVWYSDVQQLDIPKTIEEMEKGEQAIWFLQHSAIYQQEEIVGTELVYESEPEWIKVILADGSSYEVWLDQKISAVAEIYGPYPPGFSH